MAYENRPELIVSKLAVDIAESNYKIAKADHYPNLSAYGNQRIYADNGGSRNDGTEGNGRWTGLRSRFSVQTSAKLKAIGKAEASSRITGTQINQIRTSDEDQVTLNKNAVHIASDPSTSVYKDLTANAKVPKILGIKLGKTVTKKKLKRLLYLIKQKLKNSSKIKTKNQKNLMMLMLNRRS